METLNGLEYQHRDWVDYPAFYGWMNEGKDNNEQGRITAIEVR